MKRILHWIAVKLSGTGLTGPANEGGGGKEYNGVKAATSSDLQVNDDDLMPDIYGKETGGDQADDDTQPDLEIIKDSPPTSDMSEGFDPYNSGDFKIPKK